MQRFLQVLKTFNFFYGVIFLIQTLVKQLTHIIYTDIRIII